MFEKLDAVVDHYDELTRQVADPEIIANQSVWQKYMQEMGEIGPVVEKYREYRKAEEELSFAKEMLENEDDEELREMAKAEVSDQTKNLEVLEEELKILLIPKDPNDEKNVIVEIRAGAGGE